MDTIFIFGAKYLFIFSIILAGIFFFKEKRFTKIYLIIFSALTFIITFVLGIVVGHIYNNPRPFVVEHFIPLINHAANNGFPSDHVLLVAAISSIFIFVDKKSAIILWGITFLVAFSRVYVGVHHILDVVASSLIALVGATLAFTLLTRLASRISSKFNFEILLMITENPKEKKYFLAFEISIILKGIHSIVEIIGGILNIIYY